MALVGDHGRSADVMAAQDTQLAELPTAGLSACTAIHPNLATTLHLNLARILTDRLRRANEQLHLLSC
jgi:CRP-like cAMP-binding protein